MRQTDYFQRQITLVGKEKQALLQDKKVLIIGAGGLGSSLALALGTSGIGHVDIIDFDRVAYHNIHRQIAFTLEDEGLFKAEVVVALLKKKNPFVLSEAFVESFESWSQKEELKEYDLFIDATDNFEVREAIDAYAKLKKRPWIYGSVEAFQGQVCFFESSNFHIFKQNSQHQVSGVLAPMVMSIASFQANLALRYLLGFPLEKEKLFYFYFDESGILQTQKFTMPQG
jgi:adenylyltransferase/sulfurtransferase